MTSTHGGKRENSGRKPKAVLYATKIVAAERKIAVKLGDITDAMIELALGVWVEETDDEGERRVYQKPPNFKAGLDLMNRLMGRPREEAEEPEPEPEPPSHDFGLLSKEELDALKAILKKAMPPPNASGASGGGTSTAKS